MTENFDQCRSVVKKSCFSCVYCDVYAHLKCVAWMGYWLRFKRVFADENC